MGGQACVFYGAAQVSKDVDFLVLHSDENLERLHAALTSLSAVRIAEPPFDPRHLERGHAVHYRCKVPEADGLRIDIMTRLRDLPDFETLWERRTVFTEESGMGFHLLCIPDLIRAKKTQRTKDWPVIEALASIHYAENAGCPRPDWIRFWLSEIRSPELLLDLVKRFFEATQLLLSVRPLLALALDEDLPALRTALDAEMRAEQEKDRLYWEPLKREMEAFRRAERGQADG